MTASAATRRSFCIGRSMYGSTLTATRRCSSSVCNAVTELQHRVSRLGDSSPMPTTQRVDTENEPLALLNRELSALDLMTRVLELAADRDRAAARAGQVLRDRLVDPRRVLHGSGRRPARPGRVGPLGSLARRPDAPADADRGAGARARADGGQSRLWRDELCPALAREGILVGTVDDATEDELARARAAVRQPDLPGADPARRRPRAAVPVHLRPLAQPRRHRARPGVRRGALRTGQGPGGRCRASSPSARAGC